MCRFVRAQARGPAGAKRVPGGCTPLHSAAGYAHADCMAALLAKPADAARKKAYACAVDDVRPRRVACAYVVAALQTDR
jgi:hypothetical protein